MAEFLIDIFNIENKFARISLKTLFWIIKLIPYVVIFFVVGLVSFNYFGEQEFNFIPTIPQVFTTLSCIGGFTLWYFFCKVFKIIFIVVRSIIMGW